MAGRGPPLYVLAPPLVLLVLALAPHYAVVTTHSGFGISEESDVSTRVQLKGARADYTSRAASTGGAGAAPAARRASHHHHRARAPAATAAAAGQQAEGAEDAAMGDPNDDADAPPPPAPAPAAARRRHHSNRNHNAAAAAAAAAATTTTTSSAPDAAAQPEDDAPPQDDPREDPLAAADAVEPTKPGKMSIKHAKNAVAEARVAWLTALRAAAPSLLSQIPGVFGGVETRCELFATAATLFDTHAGPSGEAAKKPDYELKHDDHEVLPSQGCPAVSGAGVQDSSVPLALWGDDSAAGAGQDVVSWRNDQRDIITSEPRFGKCALVGNARSLLSQSSGLAIDTEFDAVMRTNQGPTDGFEAHVGKRTTYRLVNRKWITAYANNPNLQLEKRVTLIASRTDWALFLGACKRITKRRPDVSCRLMTRKAVDNAGNVLRAMKARVESVRGIAYPGKGSPSSGFVGLHFLMQLCRNVTVFGMSDGSSLKEAWHYFEPRQFHASRESGPDAHHSFDLEHDMLQVLDGAGVITHRLWERRYSVEAEASKRAAQRIESLGLSHADLVSERPMPRGCVKDKGAGCKNLPLFDGGNAVSASAQPGWLAEYLPYMGGTIKNHATATARSVRGGTGFPDVFVGGKVHIPRRYGSPSGGAGGAAVPERPSRRKRASSSSPVPAPEETGGAASLLSDSDNRNE